MVTPGEWIENNRGLRPAPDTKAIAGVLWAVSML